MFKIIQKFAPAPPTGVYSPVAPLSWMIFYSIQILPFKFLKFQTQTVQSKTHITLRGQKKTQDSTNKTGVN